jgi:tocopherol O-methyltransferase
MRRSRPGSRAAEFSQPAVWLPHGAGLAALDEFRERYVETVERMFAAVSDLYAQYWNDFFHFAVFERGDESWDEAFEATHRRYMRALRISEAENAVDLACGRGGFANVLAQNTRGRVLGIDLSRSQLKHCARFKRPNLHFRHHDIMKVDAVGEMFDAVSLLDADCYLPDKRFAMERIAAIVRPGGRFLLLSWCRAEGLNRIQKSLVLHPFMRYWGIPSLETARRYRSYFARSRLRVVEEVDLTASVQRNWEFGYEQALKAVQQLSPKEAGRLLWKGVRLGPDGVRLLTEQFPAALYIKAAFDCGFLRYWYFLLEKEAIGT